MKKVEMKKIAIFGTSGFAYETADVAHAMGYEEIYLICRTELEESDAGRLKIVSESNINHLVSEGFCFAVGCGEPGLRKRIANNFPDLEYPNLIHPNAVFGISQKEYIGSTRGNIITAGVIFTNNIKLGDFGVYNLSCTIGHDCIIEDFVSIMPGVNVSGNVHLKECAYLGVGAVILQGSEVSKLIVGVESVVGAGALVIKPVKDNSTVVGAPAKAFER